MALRVFIPTGVYPPDIGGPATYVPILERELPTHGLSVQVLPFGRVRHLPKGIAHVAFFLLALREAYAADVVFAQDAISVGWPSRLAAFLCWKPFVVKVVGDHVWEQGVHRFGIKTSLDAFPRWPRHPYLFFLRCLQMIVLRSATRVIVPGEYLARIAEGWGVSRERITLVYNGIDMPTRGERPADAPEHYAIVVGRLMPWKQVDAIVRAAIRGTWNLVIIGDGPERQKLQVLAGILWVSQRIRFLGTLPRDEMLRWCAYADALVLNSSYEGLPHTLIEAMSLGIPVVVSDIPGNREVVTEESQGFVVPVGNEAFLADTIDRVMAGGEDVRACARRGQERATAFSTARMTKLLADELKDICA